MMCYGNSNSYGLDNGDQLWLVPDDIIGVIWIFGKPFSELIECIVDAGHTDMIN